MKIWKPDTCECVIEEVYNGSEIIGGGEVVKKCLAHQSIADEDLYGVLYANPDGENKIKNHFYRLLLGLENIKGLGIEQIKNSSDGSKNVLELKDGVEFNWSFEGLGTSRKLKVEVKGALLTKNKKDEIQNHCDQKFGNNKIELL